MTAPENVVEIELYCIPRDHITTLFRALVGFPTRTFFHRESLQFLATTPASESRPIARVPGCVAELFQVNRGDEQRLVGHQTLVDSGARLPILK